MRKYLSLLAAVMGAAILAACGSREETELGKASGTNGGVPIFVDDGGSERAGSSERAGGSRGADGAEMRDAKEPGVSEGAGIREGAGTGEVSGLSGEMGSSEKKVESGDGEVQSVTVTQGGPYGELSLSLPAGWSYEACPMDSEDFLGDYGIRFAPEGTDAGYVEASYQKFFGVCGMGLEEEESVIGDHPVWVGTYDEADHWDFITFEGDYEGVVVLTVGTVDDWWSQYGDRIQGILETLIFRPDVREGGAYVYSKESEIPEIGLYFTLKNITSTGGTLVWNQHESDKLKGELLYGEAFTLEMQKGDDWEDVPVALAGEYGFHDVAYTIAPDSSTEKEFSWDWLYGELPPGTYRLGKRVFDSPESGKSKEYRVYAEFILN